MALAILWANEIIAGDRTYDEVPRLLKEKVAQVLINAGFPELVTQ